MKIDHISISRESVWKQCQQQYKYKYHLQLPMVDPPPIYLTFGKIVHRIIEEFTKARGDTDINVIKNKLLKGELDLEPGKKAPTLSFEYKQKLAVHLSHFLKLTEKIGLDGDIEWQFKIDLDPPHGRYLLGFIDRMIFKDDKVFIIDYKTSKVSPWRKDHKTITKDLQLQCYCWIAMNTFKVPAKNVSAALFYLEDGKLVPARFGESTLESVPQRLLQVYKEIQISNADHVAGQVGEYCRRCDFRKICPFYSLV